MALEQDREILDFGLSEMVPLSWQVWRFHTLLTKYILGTMMSKCKETSVCVGGERAQLFFSECSAGESRVEELAVKFGCLQKAVVQLA